MIEKKIIEKPETKSDLLSHYKDILMDAQIKGKKWIELTPELMDVALVEISVATGSDMSAAKSFVQNDIRVYMEGSKEALDLKENKIAGC